MVDPYGQLTEKDIKELKAAHGKTILDNAQAYFKEPVPGVDTVYTARKYFGVPDGGFVASEAKLGRDKRGQLLIRNELVGHYRKAGDRDKAFASAEEALRLLEELDFSDNISAATTYTNVATAFNAFGENERSLSLFEKARAVYEASPRTSPDLLGGLYNNMALTCTALGRYAEAFTLYDQAMDVMARVPAGVLEQAITCLNRADTLAAQLGMEQAEGQINDLLDQAWDLLQDPAAPHDGYYAFVCEKCAPAFSYYGYFLAAQELQDTAKAIYERA